MNFVSDLLNVELAIGDYVVFHNMVLEKTYDGESIVGLSRDIDESLEDASTNIPKDEYNIQKGTFRVTITWSDE